MFAIRPSRDIRQNYKEIAALCKKNPVAITVNGREDTVLMSHEDYCAQQAQIREMQEQLKLFEALARAEEDIKNGRVYPEENFFEEIFKKIDEM